MRSISASHLLFAACVKNVPKEVTLATCSFKDVQDVYCDLRIVILSIYCKFSKRNFV